VWNTEEVVRRNAGVPVLCKSGHTFIKEKMREADAIYGGEMSAHHYFRDFFYCDSGMIPWLLVLALVRESGKPLSQLVDAAMARYPASGEINRKVSNSTLVLQEVIAHYADMALSVDYTDGFSACFAEWRFNLRLSNTEPVIRLNVESRGDVRLMQAKTAEVLAMLV
jgi:phosphomannomutase